MTEINHMITLQEKQDRLQNYLHDLESVMIAYSGGVDSAYLAWCARQTPGLKMLAVLADSPSPARHHFKEAVDFAIQQDIPLEVIETSELEDESYVKNDMYRCFHRKSELFTKMAEAKSRLGFRHIAYGMNMDDRGDFRPGQKAAIDHEVLAPLVEAGMTKSDIQTLAHDADLRVRDKPASAGLSSRIAYGNPVTRSALQRVEQSEEYFRRLGFRQFRVRDHDGLARIEISPEELDRTLSSTLLKTITVELRLLGFKYVTLDCAGYQSGSMNHGISTEVLSDVHARSLS
jgi:pyridinium-3,5-biscarboxylic acid mononucleotide sulfurtransferase